MASWLACRCCIFFCALLGTFRLLHTIANMAKDEHGAAPSPEVKELGYDGGDSQVDVHIPQQYWGTAADQHDMHVLGKRQVLRRNFNGITMLGFSSMVMVAWEALLVVIVYPLLDGGPPNVFWGLIIAPIGMTFVYLSLAEMASM